MAKKDYTFLQLCVNILPYVLCITGETVTQSAKYEQYDYVTEQVVPTIGDIIMQTNDNRKYTVENNTADGASNLSNNSNDKANNDGIINSTNTKVVESDNVTIEFGQDPSLPKTEFKNVEYQVSQNEVVHEEKFSNVSNNVTQIITTDSTKADETTTMKALTPKDIVQGNIDHPCKRKCIAGEDRMTCYYKFNVEWYYSMSKACFNCSVNESDCYSPDCVTADGIKRPIIVVNRTLPGPSVEVCLGDKIIVDVHNHLMEESTSIHWHGQHQRESPYMDGVPFITQCPIPPHNTFRYHYLAATPGTHFWHSHSGCQRTDGMIGNMIVRMPRSEDPHSNLYDEDLTEHTINVMDWAHQLGVSMFVAHYHSDGSNKPGSMIVNGKGRFFNDSESVTTTPLAVFTVKKGVRYRFRLINSGNQNCPIELSIDNHTLTVINSDGGNFQPVEGAALVTYAGERWDFVLTANGEVKNYWMRFRGLMDCDERFTKAHQVAILRYEGAPEQDPTEAVSYFGSNVTGLVINAMNVRMDDPNSVSVPELNAIDNKVKSDTSFKETPDHQLYIGYDFYPVDTNKYHKPKLYGFKEVTNRRERVFTPQFNHISMKMPTVPLLSQRDSVSPDMFCDHQSLKDCATRHCECTNVVEIPLGDVVELILIDEGNTYNANHPFHLHGHAFRVIGMDKLGNNTSVEFVRNADKAGQLRRNLENAPLKDSVTVPDGGYTIIRFHGSNPGYWLFHCHLEFHVEVGMALIFKIGDHSQFPPVPEKFPVCGDYLYPKLPTEMTQSLINKENEVNFGEDYSLAYNATSEDGKNKNKEGIPFLLSQLRPITNDASRTSVIGLTSFSNVYKLLIITGYFMYVCIIIV